MVAEVGTMEVKKVSSGTATVVKEVVENQKSSQDFLTEIKGEFSKISWTDPDELKAYTKMVVVATFIFGMGLYGVDLAIQGVLNTLGYIIHFIFG